MFPLDMLSHIEFSIGSHFTMWTIIKCQYFYCSCATIKLCCSTAVTAVLQHEIEGTMIIEEIINQIIKLLNRTIEIV